MATNLRLRPDAEEAVRLEAQRTGRSQQAVIREAIDRHLGLAPRSLELKFEELVADPRLRLPRSPYRKAARRIELPAGITSSGLL
ncbi:MAG TPA: hypothetical protein VJ938_05225, partial [Acidimicrobiia bacterium]|nr:hypothetical protein [Acidimicrobiia bacterium]